MGGRLRDVLADLRRRFETLYGTRLAGLVLYGSQARGDAGMAQILICLSCSTDPVRPGEEIRRTLDDVADLSLRNNVVISCVFVSDERFRQEESPLLINVRRGGVPV
jgi:uncharacterized protein